MDKEKLRSNLQSYNWQKEDMIVQTVEEIVNLLNINIDENHIFLSKIETEEKICMLLENHIIITTPVNIKEGNIQYQIYPFTFKEIRIQQRNNSQSFVEIVMENDKSIVIQLRDKACVDCINEIIKEKIQWKN